MADSPKRYWLIPVSAGVALAAFLLLLWVAQGAKETRRHADSAVPALPAKPPPLDLLVEKTEVGFAVRPVESVYTDLRAAVGRDDWQSALNLEADLAKCGPAAVPYLENELRQTQDRETTAIQLRQHVAWVLGEIGTPEARAALTQALHNGDELAVRGQVLLALSRLQGPEALKALYAVLLDPAEDADQRTSAALLLAKRAEPEATQFLVELVRSHEHADAEEWAVDALGFATHAELARPLLMELARSGTPDSLRGEAVLALGRLDKTAAVETLGQVLRTDPANEVRQKAVVALGEMESSKAVRELLLQSLASDISMSVRALSAQRLGVPGHEELLPPLQDALSADRAAYVQQCVILSMGKIGGKQAEGMLQQIAATTTSVALRKAANAALQEMRGEKKAPPSQEGGAGF